VTAINDVFTSHHLWSAEFVAAYAAAGVENMDDVDYELVWGPMFIRSLNEAQALASDRSVPDFDHRLAILAAMVAELDARCPETVCEQITFWPNPTMQLTVLLKDMPELLSLLSADSKSVPA
jgi:hypothetical protein